MHKYTDGSLCATNEQLMIFYFPFHMRCSLTHSQFWPQEKQKVWLLFHTISAHFVQFIFSRHNSWLKMISGAELLLNFVIRAGVNVVLAMFNSVVMCGLDMDTSIVLSDIWDKVMIPFLCLYLFLSAVLSGLCSNNCPEKVKVSSNIFFSFMQDTLLEWQWHVRSITRPTFSVFLLISEEIKLIQSQCSPHSLPL